MNYMGFFRVTAASPLVRIADLEYNLRQCIDVLKREGTCRDLAEECELPRTQSDLIVYPELSLSAYTCGDLFHNEQLLDSTEEYLLRFADETKEYDTLIFIGAPLRRRGQLYNCAVAVCRGRILAVIPKTFLPNYNEFYEKRWFASGAGIEDGSITIGDGEVPFGTDVLVRHKGVLVGAEICEDVWVPMPPAERLARGGADVVVNLSATDELIGKHDYLLDLLRGVSARCRCGYVYASAGPCESSTDALYAGNAIIAEDGRILRQSPRFTLETQTVTADFDISHLRHDRMHFETFYEGERPRFRIINTGAQDTGTFRGKPLRFIDPHPFVPGEGPRRDERCREVTSIQTGALAQRLRATGCRNLTVGISGGLDSTLALLIACRAFDLLGLPRIGIHAISMPGFGTTKRTHSNAATIMRRLGVSHHEIPIGDAVMQHFHDIGHDPSVHDVTYENSQARERTQILMDFANRVGGMVLGTGDLSELALGWCTYNADHMSMYGVNCSVPKTLVRHLVAWMANAEEDEELRRALFDIVDTPVSPELLPADDKGDIAQKTEDLVGPYELHDFFLYEMLRYGSSPKKIYRLALHAFAGGYPADVIKHWLKTFIRRFFNQQFKRSCLPDGPKTGSVSLSPRADWRMPSDATSRLWLEEADKL